MAHATRRRWRYASAFTGIGGFERGFADFGDPEVFIEYDAACQRVLRHHFPDVPLMGDIKDVEPRELGAPEVFVAGFPCTDVSIGHPARLGLAGPESGNFWHFHRCLYDYVRLIDATRPRVVVLENPVGLLTSPGVSKGDAGDGVDRTGFDMAAVTAALGDLGYGWAYRVLDAGFFGTPQRRERVIVVGHRGGDPGPAVQILGLNEPGAEAAPPRQVRGRPLRPAAVGSTGAPGEPIVLRKSARARASLAKGGYETWVDDGRANTLTKFDAGLADRQTHLVIQDGGVRGLTPTEWERLQGFPDGWTDVPGASDSSRFNQLGNAMHVGMARWLGGRITEVLADLPQISSPSPTEVP